MVTPFSDFRRRELARWVIVLAQFSFCLVKVTVDLSSLEPLVDKHSLSDFLDSAISLTGAPANSGLGRGVTHIVIVVEFDAVSSPSGLASHFTCQCAICRCCGNSCFLLRAAGWLDQPLPLWFLVFICLLFPDHRRDDKLIEAISR